VENQSAIRYAALAAYAIIPSSRLGKLDMEPWTSLRKEADMGDKSPKNNQKQTKQKAAKKAGKAK
jgi:hypothetical protein